MMADFGDVLRGLGSVLNPQVMQDVNAERARQQAQQQQIGGMLLQDQLRQAQEKRALAIQQASPEYQAKLEALKNEQGFRAGAAKLDPNAADYYDQMAKLATQHGKPEVAANIFKAKEDRSARLQTAAEANQARRDKLEQDNRLAMERISDARERQAWQQQYQQQSLALQAQNAQIANQMKLLGLEIQRDKARQQTDQQVNQQVTKLGAALEKSGLPEADSVLGSVEAALKKTPNLAEYLTGPKSLVPDFAVPDDVKAGRQALDKLFNITLKNRSGAAVTSQELDRLKAEFGRGAFKTPQQIENAVNQARTVITNHYASIASGFGKDVLGRYNSNAQELGAREIVPVTPGAPAADVPPPPPGFKVDRKK